MAATSIPGLEIVERLGAGGMAVVWKARQVALDRLVAVKVLKADYSEDPGEAEAFLDEARMAARLKHPNIVQVYDVGEHDGTTYIVMEYVDGPTIAEWIEANGAMPQKQALRIARAVASALAYAWEECHLIHKDVKPDNIMIDHDHTVKVSDLGLARMLDARHLSAQLQSGTIEGTPNYISPEQAQCFVDLNYRADMYSLGATLYHMLTGRIPFGECTTMQALERQAHGTLPNPRDINPNITVSAAQLVSKLMTKDPAARYSSWNDAIAALRKAASGRMLLSSWPDRGTSTIEPPRGGAPTAPSAPARQTPEGIPVPVRLVAWALLCAGWFLLTVALFDLGPLTSLPERFAGWHPPAPTAPSPETAEANRQPQGTPARAAEALPPEAADRLATLVLNGDIEGALLTLDTSDVSAAARASMQALLRDADALDARVGKALLRSLGRELTLTLDGRTRTVIPRALAGTRVNARLIDKDTGRRPSITFDLHDLTASDKRRLLGTPHTASDFTMHFILAMQAGDFTEAEHLAGGCGPLAEAFTRAAHDAAEEG